MHAKQIHLLLSNNLAIPSKQTHFRGEFNELGLLSRKKLLIVHILNLTLAKNHKLSKVRQVKHNIYENK